MKIRKKARKKGKVNWFERKKESLRKQKLNLKFKFLEKSKKKNELKRMQKVFGKGAKEIKEDEEEKRVEMVDSGMYQRHL